MTSLSSDSPPVAADDETRALTGETAAPEDETISGGNDREGEERLPPFPLPWRHPLQAAAWTVRTLFGVLSLVFLLAVVAAVPIVNFIALGYFIEVEGRVARSGRIRDALPLLSTAPRIGSIALGIWVLLLPLRYAASVAADARLIAPGSPADVGWNLAVRVLWVVIAAHILLSLARGGSPGCFLRPLKNVRWLYGQLQTGRYLPAAGQNVRAFLRRLRIRHHFWLGLRGFAVAFAWLALPTAFYAAVREPEGGQIVLMVLGGAMLVVTLSWAPFLQARFAAEQRLRTGFQLREVRELYRHAPLACMLATVFLYLLALPLYLFKAFLLPQDAMWFVTLVFIVSIYPTRVLTGWAYYQAARRRAEGRKAHLLWRLGCSAALVPLMGIYVFILFFTQFLGEHGKGVLFEHHALLLPVPF